jgi:hypothetical protein
LDGHCWTCTDGRRAAPSDFAQMTAATTYARKEQVKGSIHYRTATDLPNNRLTVPPADHHPRRGAGRKGAFGVAMRWRQAPPVPPTPRRAQRPGQGNGAGAGSDSTKGAVDPCPPPALQRRHLRSFRANHGQLKLLLTNSVLARSCNSQAHVIQRRLCEDSASGWSKPAPPCSQGEHRSDAPPRR